MSAHLESECAHWDMTEKNEHRKTLSGWIFSWPYIRLNWDTKMIWINAGFECVVKKMYVQATWHVALLAEVSVSTSVYFVKKNRQMRRWDWQQLIRWKIWIVTLREKLLKNSTNQHQAANIYTGKCWVWNFWIFEFEAYIFPTMPLREVCTTKNNFISSHWVRKQVEQIQQKYTLN